MEGILLENLEEHKIYIDRLSEDRVLIDSITAKSYEHEGAKTAYLQVIAQRYNRSTGEIDTMFYPSDYQLKEME